MTRRGSRATCAPTLRAVEAVEAMAEEMAEELRGARIALNAAKALLGSREATRAAFFAVAVRDAEARKDREIDSLRACNEQLTNEVEAVEAMAAGLREAQRDLADARASLALRYSLRREIEAALGLADGAAIEEGLRAIGELKARAALPVIATCGVCPAHAMTLLGSQSECVHRSLRPIPYTRPHLVDRDATPPAWCPLRGRP